MTMERGEHRKRYRPSVERGGAKKGRGRSRVQTERSGYAVGTKPALGRRGDP